MLAHAFSTRPSYNRPKKFGAKANFWRRRRYLENQKRKRKVIFWRWSRQLLRERRKTRHKRRRLTLRRFFLKKRFQRILAIRNKATIIKPKPRRFKSLLSPKKNRPLNSRKVLFAALGSIWPPRQRRHRTPHRRHRKRRKPVLIQKYRRYVRRTLKSIKHFKVAPSRHRLHLALVNWRLSGNNTRSRKKKLLRRFRRLRKRRMKRVKLYKYKITKRIPVTFTKYASKRQYLLLSQASLVTTLVPKLRRTFIASSTRGHKHPRYQLKHMNFIATLKQFQSTYLKSTYRSSLLSHQPQDLLITLRQFIRSYYKKAQKTRRFILFDETSIYHLRSYDKRMYKKWKLCRPRYQVRKTKPWLKFLIYKRSVYKFNFYKPYLRDRPIYKTKRNKLYSLFIRISYNNQKPPKFKPNKRGGNRSFHYVLLLKKILYPVFGRKVKAHQLKRDWARHQCIKTITGRHRALLRDIETKPSILATKLGWAPTIEWSKHFGRNDWYSVSRGWENNPTRFPSDVRSIPHSTKYPLYGGLLTKYTATPLDNAYDELFTGSHRTIKNLNNGDMLQISPKILALIKTTLRTKPKWSKPVFRNYMDINPSHTSALILKAPRYWHLRKRDRNNPYSMRFLLD